MRGLDHPTRAVRDLDRSVRFHEDRRGARLARRWRGRAHLAVGHLWLCLSLDRAAERGHGCAHAVVDVSAADVDAARGHQRAAAAREWKRNMSAGQSHCLLAPTGIGWGCDPARSTAASPRWSAV